MLGEPQWQFSLIRTACQVLLLGMVLFLAPQTGLAQSGPGSNLVFSGTANVSVPHAAALNAYPLTLAAWVRTTQNDSSFRGIVSKASATPTNGYALTVCNGNVMAAYARSATSSVLNGTNPLDGGYIADGTWHHVALVVSATGGRLYVDGQLQASHAWNGAAQACTPSTSLLLGRYNGATLNCSLDEVALWNVALSQSQIQAGMHLPLTGAESGLVGYWRLDEGSGATTLNRSSAGSVYDGTLVGSPSWAISTAPIGLPVASTLPASGVGSYTATLNGTVLPNCQDTTAYFEYGTTTAYGSTSSSTVIGASNGAAVPVALGISGLASATSYHYRLVAVNSAGTSYGNDAVLNTTPSSDASLSNLTLSSAAFSPPFSPATLSYSATAPNAAVSVTVTPYVSENHATARVRVNGGAYVTVNSGSPSGALPLAAGGNPIDIQVKAQDGVTVRTYTLTVNRLPSTWYVATNGLDNAAGASWATAKQTIQAAIDAALPIDLVLVSNGVYATGGRIVAGAISNRVVIDKPITVASVNGPSLTLIKGNGYVSDQAVRCVYAGTNAVLAGFTLTNGATRGGLGDPTFGQSGGGAWCEATAVLTNCILSGCQASASGGGAYRGTLFNCILSRNTNNVFGFGAGAYDSSLYGCALSNNFSFTSGGGCYTSTVVNCTLVGNCAGYYGGGAFGSVLSNCTLSLNSVTNSSAAGGGAHSCTLSQCVLSTNYSASLGGGAYNCVLSNCTLSANAAASYGGGAYGGTLTRCTLEGNFLYASGAVPIGGGAGAVFSTLANCQVVSNNVGAFLGGARYGGGTYYCNVNNSAFIGNQASLFGGAALGGTLTNCTLSGNSATFAGGAYQSTLNNCVVYFNTASAAPNSYGCTFNYSCTAPAAAGPGNITGDPGLAGPWRLSSGSRCIGRGSASFASGTALDGQAWLNPPSMGCDQPVSGSSTGVLAIAAWAAYTNVAVGFPVQFRALTQSRATATAWDWGDSTGTSNQAYTVHSFQTSGAFNVTVAAYGETPAQKVSDSLIVTVADRVTHYVRLGNATPLAPYTSWATAATNIQDAIDAASQVGARIVVSNGVYDTGMRINPAGSGAWTRVSINKPVTVQSLNGPAVTIIKASAGVYGMNCAYVGASAVLWGFTLTNGDYTLYTADKVNGAGASCDNSARLVNCILTGNRSGDSGGGSYGGTLDNCLLYGNSAVNLGGGSSYSTLNNCTVSGNNAGQAGGSWGSTHNNCIVYGNASPIWPDHDMSEFAGSCTSPLPPGSGNITNAPLFLSAASSNYRLNGGSPCIDAGLAMAPGPTDLDGNARVIHGLVDMGAYEFQGYWAWAAAITNGLTNLTDCATGDGYRNLLKYATGSSATQPDSLARLDGTLSPSSKLFALRFNRNINALDVTLLVEASDSVANGALWSAIATNSNGSWGGATNVIEAGNGNPIAVTVQDTVLPPDRRFFRLRVKRP